MSSYENHHHSNFRGFLSAQAQADIITILSPPTPPHHHRSHYHDDHHHNHRHCNGRCSLLSLRTGGHGLPIVASAGRNTQLGGENRPKSSLLIIMMVIVIVVIVIFVAGIGRNTQLGGEN